MQQLSKMAATPLFPAHLAATTRVTERQSYLHSGTQATHALVSLNQTPRAILDSESVLWVANSLFLA